MAEADDSRLPMSEREREADVGRGVVSVASWNESCEREPGQRRLRSWVMVAGCEEDTHGVPIGRAVRARGPGGGGAVFHGVEQAVLDANGARSLCLVGGREEPLESRWASLSFNLASGRGLLRGLGWLGLPVNIRTVDGARAPRGEARRRVERSD